MSTPHPPTQDLCIPLAQWRALVRAADAQPPARSPTPAAPASTPKPLPPGVVLDENGKPCKVCNSWRTWAKIGKNKGNPAAAETNTHANTGAAAGTAAAAFASLATTSTSTAIPHQPPAAQPDAAPSTRPLDCPPDVETLGRATWTFLHTTAAYYPAHPSPAQQSCMRQLIAGVAAFYPCSYCRKDFAQSVRAVEPDVSGREGLSRWMCERHNEVNVKLGKEAFDCGRVMERWKDGPEDGRCD